MRRGGLVLYVLASACGAATTTTIVHTETAPAPAPWNAAMCPPSSIAGDNLHLVERSGTTQYVLDDFLRLRIDGDHLTMASTLTTDPLIAARRLGGAWVFATSSGMLLSSGDDFLGPLETIATLSELPHDVVGATGALAFALEGRTKIAVYGGDEVVEIEAPGHPFIIAAAVDWPARVALFVEPGVLLLSTDRGQTFHEVTLPRAPWTLGVDDGAIWINWRHGTTSVLAADETLAPGGQPYEQPVEMPTEPWCAQDVPFALAASWPAGTPVEVATPPDCSTRQGVAVIVAFCEDESRSGSQIVRRLDVATQEFVAIGRLDDASFDFDVADASGSATFALLYEDSTNASHTAYFDGHGFVPVTIEARLTSVHGALGIATTGDDATTTLVHLPDGATIPLALPVNDEITSVAFAVDGSLIVTTSAEAGGALWIGRPGTWSRRTVPEGVLAVAMADAVHGVARADGVFVTNDGGEHWDAFELSSSLDRPLGDDLVCAAAGCSIGGAITFRAQPATVAPSEIDTSTDLDENQPRAWIHRRTPTWTCTTSARMTFDGAPDVHATEWGWIDPLQTGATEMTWSGADERGAYHSHAPLPPNAFVADAAVMTRRFAAGFTPEQLVVASAAPHTITLEDLAPSLGAVFNSVADTAVLDDGSALVTLQDDEGTVRYELVVYLDASGVLVRSRSFAWSTVGFRDFGLAAGPNGVVGRAAQAAEDGHWIVYPLDRAAPIVLDASLDEQLACGSVPRPWTLVATGPVRLATRGGGDSGENVTNVLRIGDDGACVSAVLDRNLAQSSPTGLSDFLPSARVTRGQIRGLALDRSAHGHLMTCTVSRDAPQADRESDDCLYPSTL
jgi:hypothetical protein